MKHTSEEIKYRLSDLGVQIGNIAIEYITELEKENAELKEKYVKNITDCDICDTYCNSQLTKAKELLKKFIETSNPIYFEEDRQKVKAEAEQFLKE